MQFSAIRTYCATRFRDTGNVIVTDAQWKDYVNTAYGDTLMRMPYAPWNEASTTVTIAASTRSGSLPTNVFKVLAVYDATNGFPMVPLEGRAQVFNEYPQQTEVGQAMHYRIFGGSLYVYPLPQSSTSYTVEYLVMPADLSADGDVPAFPEVWHDILVSGAVALAYRDDGNIAMAQEYEKEAAAMMAALIQDAMQPRQDRYYEIVDTNW
jgi:hypothetical protein